MQSTNRRDALARLCANAAVVGLADRQPGRMTPLQPSKPQRPAAPPRRA